ncbi:hypothetical protein BJP34_09930 [Moorena producens PAL-8-15-08-1]|uniref:phosphoserine phosphatase n=1 Tax=Moorena producens PAL-8-15-08-1 TaxID=1458985 RepID=A0A1D8U2X2_9CYAN|nr:hypothetical protein BJP34_09930 [Moorena producens PAL-8-15-08-1]
MACPPAAADFESLLVSWNDGPTKTKIVNFVDNVINTVDPSDRIAVFDNDGTLWTEKPDYIQVSFIEYYRGINPSVNLETPDCSTEPQITPEQYKQEARQFLDTQNHPYLGFQYIQLTFKPMVELVNYLQSNDFKVYISSGGGTDFIRSFAEDAYGIPPENIIGTTTKAEYCDPENDGTFVLLKTKILVEPINDGKRKPVGIDRYIGKKPIMAVGNSSGDLQMLDYTDDHIGPALMMLLHHDDTRECPYAELAQIDCPYDDPVFDVANDRR